MLLENLFTQRTSLLSIRDYVLNSNLLCILRAEVIPIDLGNVKKTKRIFLHLNLHLFFHFLTSQKLALLLDKCIPLRLRQIVLPSRRLECRFNLLSF